MTAVAESWVEAAAALRPRAQAFIDGAFVPAASGATFADTSPRDGALVADVARGGPEDVGRAVASGRAAFEAGGWSQVAPRERRTVLLRLADLMEERLEQLALLESVDVGKPIGDALRVDVPNAAACLRWYAEAVDKRYGEVAPTGRDALALIEREPLGVVGAVVPWNFPLTMAGWKLGPALATGNTVVLKPAEQSPVSALRLAELATQAGIPDGVVNVVPGFGETAGQALGRHAGVDVVTFTGSTDVGRMFLRYAADSNVKPVWLELGGKTPNIVLADAPDLDTAAAVAAWGIFFNTGQMCTAASRLLVEERVADEVVGKVVTAARARRIGDPLDPQTELGPLVDAAQRDRVLGYVERGTRDGATLAFGGGTALEETGGTFVEPTVFTGVRNDMAIAREEIFGPVLSVITFRDLDEAIALANDTPYGLAASVWTSDLSTAHRAARALRAGTVWVNCFEEGDLTVPFGGRKASGFGADKSLHAMEKFTALKTTWIQL
jgi:acyl-CoA reductase-like NAD-dependent aldehyde dehydrogenase